MGRKSRPSLKATQAKIEIGPEAALPFGVVEYFQSLPALPVTDASASSQDEEDRRGAKRRKLDSAANAGICVARGEIIICRRYDHESRQHFAEHRQDIGSSLKFLTVNGDLLVVSRPSTTLGSFRCLFHLKKGEMSRSAYDIIDVAGLEMKQDLAGSIWTTVSLDLKFEDGTLTLKFSLELFWNETPSPYYTLRPNKSRRTSQKLIDAFFPSSNQSQADIAWSPMDFYETAYVPSRDDPTASSIIVPDLEATLFPYQKRTLQWLLSREGKVWDQNNSSLRDASLSNSSPTIETFREVNDVNGTKMCISDLFQTITRSTELYHQAEYAVKGGILAEEMGLGKTLEILGLILLHSRAQSDFSQPRSENHNLTPSRATLIVTPESLRDQWVSEIGRHAPGLRIRQYKGCRKDFDSDGEDAVNELADYDIVLTTYSVLSAELHFATTPPERSRRYSRAYPRVMSPLVKISWWRLCLDEAQMVENGFTQAATVARVIPRRNAWGITGTPVKDHVKDLFGLLLFLRYQPFCSAPQIWQALLTHHKSIFQQLFNSIALRHTKTLVKDELTLPAQKRYVVGMPFTAVEEQHYQSLYRQMAEDCRLNLKGVPLDDEWELKDFEEKMRTWLNRLRQTVLHPEVGVYNRRVLGHSKTRPMRTIEEVLTAMLEQSENVIRIDERAYISTRLTRGQLYENSPRVKEALVIWEEVRKEAVVLVNEARNKLSDVLKEQRATETNQTQNDADSGDSEDEGMDEVDQETRSRLGDLRRRLRAALELQHRAVFFCANAYFQIRENKDMTDPESEEFAQLKKMEDEGYEQAKAVRREILRGPHRKASRHMIKLTLKAENQSFVEIPELVPKPEKGIESGNVAEKLEVLYEELNDQANVLDEWREHLVQLLLKPLVDEEDDVENTGEELVDSTKIQDKVMVYVQALRAGIADRQDAISGQTNLLVKHETETSLKVAKEGKGPAPEKVIELLTTRTRIKPQLAQTSMRGAIGEFRALQTRFSRDGSLSSRGAVEAQIAADQLSATQAALGKQNKAALALESEIESFTDAMNARLEYYRQLQVVSDSVLPYEGPRTEGAIVRLKQTEADLQRKLSTSESKHRYLVNLKEAGSKSNEPRTCVICQAPFMIGVLTVCGHEFCKECLTIWLKAHHNCPVCKRGLKASNLHDISLKRKELQIHSEGSSQPSGESTSPSQLNPFTQHVNSSIYSSFSADQLAEITNIDLDGPSFTTKVDTLVRHLLWLRENDPGAKSIVYSQYKDFLDVLRNAFGRFKIGHASIDDAGGINKFKHDLSTECFLLHARAHSSGLNLVNASHVFLCEPLLNTALELQAIARVDRIGQVHETTVWLYLVSGTVEESIHNLAVQRRMEHMGRSLKTKSRAATPTPDVMSANLDAANTLELENAALSKLMSRDKTAGEQVDRNDLWQCLFGQANNNNSHAEATTQLGDDDRVSDKAIMGYLAGEAALARR